MAKRPDHICCGNCIFWESDNGSSGECKRYPVQTAYPYHAMIALANIAWNTGMSAGVGEAHMKSVDDDIAAEAVNMDRREVDHDDWCGEFKGEW